MRRVALAAGALALGLAGSGAAARGPGAHDFVAAIYAAHIGPNEGFALDGDDDFGRYFEPALADRMIRDAHDASARHDRARPGYDVFVDAGRSRRRASPSRRTARVARSPP